MQALDRHARVLHPQRELGRARAGAGHALDVRRERLPVGVPHPRDVAAVGDAVVEHPEEVELAALERERAQDLVGARRVLDQQDRGRAAVELDRLRAPEGGLDRAEPGGDGRQLDAQRQAQGGGPERVVDVVEPGQRQLDAGRALGRAQREGGGADAAQLDRLGGHRGLGAAVAAVGAVVAAEVAHVGGLVDVGVAAAAAVLGVGGVLELLVRHRVVLDAEVPRLRAFDAAEVGHQRVVGVEHELGARRRARRPPPPSGRRSCRARRSGRAGRGTGWRAASPAG